MLCIKIRHGKRKLQSAERTAAWRRRHPAGKTISKGRRQTYPKYAGGKSHDTMASRKNRRRDGLVAWTVRDALDTGALRDGRPCTDAAAARGGGSG